MKKSINKIISWTGIFALFVSLFASFPARQVEAELADNSNHQVADNVYGLSNPVWNDDGSVTYDCLWFGNYYQNDTEGKTKDPIKWRILSISGSDAFLIADQILERVCYDEKLVDTTWKDSSVRSWLNEDFINEAFTQEEQEAIRTATVVNSGKSGGNTQDKVYLLSDTESKKHDYGFSTDVAPDKARERKCTAYTKAQKVWGTDEQDERKGCWWLRNRVDADDEHYNTMNIRPNGEVNENGFAVSVHYVGVCPVLHLNLSKMSYYKMAGTVCSTGEVEEINKSVEINPSTSGLNSPQRTDSSVVYDCVWFGNYPQSDSTGAKKEPIKWRVLSLNGNDAFLISDNNLDYKKYNDSDENVTWETCSLRKWLNEDFYKEAFNDTERNSILTTVISNPDNLQYNVSGGNNTKDNIFLLSIDEASNIDLGFSNVIGDSDKARVWKNTAYVNKIAAQGSGAVDLSWLRSPGQEQSYAEHVEQGGGMGTCNQNVTFMHAIAPVLYLDLSNTDVWKYAGTVSTDGTVNEQKPSEDTQTVLHLSDGNIQIARGEKKQISLVVHNESHDSLTEQASNIKGESMNSTIAQVYKTSLFVEPDEGENDVTCFYRISGEKEGETDIYFSTPDGSEATCHVTVVTPDDRTDLSAGWYSGYLQNIDSNKRRLLIDNAWYSVGEYFDLSDATNLRGDEEQVYINYQIEDGKICNVAAHPSEDFDKLLYQANYIMNTDYLDETIQAKTPSEILFQASLNTGMPTSATAWKTLEGIVDTARKPENALDYTIEEKDMYMALILDALECSAKSDSHNVEYVDMTNKFAKEIDKILESDSKNFSALNLEEKQNVANMAYEKIARKTGKYLSTFKDMLDYAESALEYAQECVAYYNMNELTETSKEMLRQMYQQCPSEETALKEALEETVQILDASQKELTDKCVTGAMRECGKEAYKALVSYGWGKMMKEILKENYPAVLYVELVYDSGKYLTNTLCNTDETVEKYFNMVASVNLDFVARKAYNELKEQYVNSKTSENAGKYISAMDIMYNVLDTDCDSAYNYVDAADQSVLGSIAETFGNQDAKNVKNSIHGIQLSYKTRKNIAQTGWVSKLEYEYPIEYNNYKDLLDTNESTSKEYRIYCPVDVFVYQDGELVAANIDGTMSCSGNVTVMSYEGDAKGFYFSSEGNYTIKYVGMGTGTMNVNIFEYGSDGKQKREVCFEDLPLTYKTTYLSVDNGKTNVKDYYVISDNQGGKILPKSDSLNNITHDSQDGSGNMADDKKDEKTTEDDKKDTVGTPDNSNKTGYNNNDSISSEYQVTDDQLAESVELLHTITGMRYKIVANNASLHTVSFIGCKTNKVTKIDIPNYIVYQGVKFDVVAVDRKACKNYKKLRQIVIGKNIKSIGAQAFYGCNHLQKITVKTKKLTKKTLGTKAFYKVGSSNYKKLKIKVPAKQKQLYKKIFYQRGLSSKAKINK